MDGGVDPGHSVELLVVFHEETRCLFVKSGVGEGLDHQAFDSLNYFHQVSTVLVPVLLENVHTYFTSQWSHVRMEYFSREVSRRR